MRTHRRIRRPPGAGPAWCGACLVRGLPGAGPAWCGACLVRGLPGAGPAWCGACLVRGLGECGVPVHLAHPNRVRAFAPASGKPAKTDRLDAQILSRYGQVFALEGDPQREPEAATLPALLRRRRQLIDQRTQERNRLDRAWNAGARASTQRHIAWLDEEIARLDQEYRDTLQSSAVLSERSALYRSVPGVGELTAATLVAELPELGQGEGKGWCSLVGLAPW